MVNQSLFSYETCVHAIAGAMGSVVGMSVFYPLDIIRFRQQLADKSDNNQNGILKAVYKIIQVEGFEALYRGIRPVLLSLGTSNFVYFYAFHGLKALHKGTNQYDLLLGIAAGVLNVILTTPLWVVNSRLKISKPMYYSGLLDGIAHIAITEGIQSLWSGIGPSLILVLNPALQFAVYEALKRQVPVKSATAFFIMGAIAKTIATVATYPLQLAQTRQRHGIDKKMGTAALLLALLKAGGPGALFHGLEAKLMQTVLTAALMFMTYEKIVQYVFILLMRK